MQDRETKPPPSGHARLVRSAGVLSVFLACLLGPPGAETQPAPLAADPSQSSAPFALTFSEGRLSLDATEASSVAILHEIGRQAGITIESPPGLDETITLHFERVPLEEALKRVAENIAIFYAKGPQDPTPRITRVVVHSLGPKGPTPAASAAKPPATGKEATPRPAPFRFEFDPTQSEQKPR